MRIRIQIIAWGFLLTACHASKEATSVKVVSAADYPYIEKFHEGVRLKAKGQLKEAIAAFQFCFEQRPEDDAVALA
jgi:hypothetical protein